MEPYTWRTRDSQSLMPLLLFHQAESKGWLFKTSVRIGVQRQEDVQEFDRIFSVLLPCAASSATSRFESGQAINRAGEILASVARILQRRDSRRPRSLCCQTKQLTGTY